MRANSAAPGVLGSVVAGRAAQAVGYTGLGVGATYWGAQIALDLLEGRDSEAADRREGRRALWLGALDRRGPGFGFDT